MAFDFDPGRDREEERGQRHGGGFLLPGWRRLESLEHLRAAWAEVDLEAIMANVRAIRSHLAARAATADVSIGHTAVGRARVPAVMAIVKANGYGHGAAPVAAAALAAGAERLGVAIVEEALTLRHAGIEAPIHILGQPPAGQASLVVSGGFSCAVCDLEAARALAAAAREQGTVARVHVKIDTGMSRLGVLPEAASDLVEQLVSIPGLSVEGAFTHFSSADEVDKTYTRAQFERFTAVKQELEKRGFRLPYWHAANSATTIDLPEMALDGVRPGIILYGLWPSRQVGHAAVTLRPAMSLKARLSCVKQVPAGVPVSYGRTFWTERPTTLGVMPIGYADGYTRLLSGKAEVLFKGARVPVVGRICMDQCVVAIPDSPRGSEETGERPIPARSGDEVVIIGRQLDDEITVDDVAARLGTINYEVVCMVGARVPRVYRYADAWWVAPDVVVAPGGRRE